MCNLHWCYTFCTGVTLFALVLHLNCTALSQSESSNFFMYIINIEIVVLEAPLAVIATLLSWIHLIDVHQNAVFEMGKNR